MKQKLRCEKRDPNKVLFNSRDFSISTDNTGAAFVDTQLKCRLWSDPKDEIQLFAFTRAASKPAKTHSIILKSDDLMIVELQTAAGREYIVSTSPKDMRHE
jgi:hypothetical protein